MLQRRRQTLGTEGWPWGLHDLVLGIGGNWYRMQRFLNVLPIFSAILWLAYGTCTQ